MTTNRDTKPKEKNPRPHRKRRTPKPGVVPGTVSIDPNALPSVVSIFGYGPSDFREEKQVKFEELLKHRESWPVTWINVTGLGSEDVIKGVEKAFNIHRLALEDVVNVFQRPKVENYDGFLFIIARLVSHSEKLETEQISILLGENYVLTFQEHPGDCLDPVRDRIRKGLGRIRQKKADFLAYSILDAIVDSYFPILEGYGEALQGMEDKVLYHPKQETISVIHGIKRELLALRKTIWPQREAINSLLRDQPKYISEDTQLYLRDCYDHAIQVMDLLEHYRETASGLVDLYLSSMSNKMNEIMKVLTMMASIFIPVTFIAGIYGMNFNSEKSPWNMPELSWYWGYPTALAVMAAVAGFMILFFRKKGWIGRGRKRK